MNEIDPRLKSLAMELPPEEESKKAKKKLPYYFGSAVLLLALGVALLFFFWTLQPTNVLVIKNQPIPAKYGLFNGQRTVDTIFNYCKTGDTTGQLSYDFVSTTTVIAGPVNPAASNSGCKDGVHIPVAIPKQAPPDTYHIHWNVSYRLNPIRIVTVQWDTQDFKVTDPAQQ
jgi:hypothetical protein